MPKLAIVCFDGVTDIDVFLHWDILNRPRTHFRSEPGWEVLLIGTETSHTTRAGLVIQMHGKIDDVLQMDAVIVASGPATRQLMHDKTYLSRLSLESSRQFLGAQCSGSLILAGSGSLEGLSATTHASARLELESCGISFVAEPLVAHDRVATAAGCLAGISLDRWLLAKFLPEEIVSQCIASASPWGLGLEELEV